MMEAARHQPGAELPGEAAKPAVLPPSAAAERASAERFPDLDAQLLERAAHVEQEMRAMPAPTSGDAPKKAALAEQAHEKVLGASSETSRRERAARFFATHGMGAVGKLLGEEMSASEASQAEAEAEAAHQ